MPGPPGRWALPSGYRSPCLLVGSGFGRFGADPNVEPATQRHRVHAGVVFTPTGGGHAASLPSSIVAGLGGARRAFRRKLAHCRATRLARTMLGGSHARQRQAPSTFCHSSSDPHRSQGGGQSTSSIESAGADSTGGQEMAGSIAVTVSLAWALMGSSGAAVSHGGGHVARVGTRSTPLHLLLLIALSFCIFGFRFSASSAIGSHACQCVPALSFSISIQAPI